jgi:hypothetical protein
MRDVKRILMIAGAVLAVGLLPALALSTLALWVACAPLAGGDAETGEIVAPVLARADEEPAPPTHPDGVAFYGDVYTGLEPIPVRPLDAEPGDRPYVSANWSGGQIVSYETRVPGGAVTGVIHTFVLPDGGRQFAVRDGYGTLIAVHTFTADGRYRQTSRAGVQSFSGCHEFAVEMDERGLVVRQTCLDDQGRSIIDESGCSEARSVWAEAGDLLEMACFDDQGRPTTDASGQHRTEIRYDHRGLERERAFFDEDAAPVARADDGCVRWRTERDDRGLPVGGTCLDAGGLPTEAAGSAHAGFRDEVDGHGCVVSRRYETTSGAPSALGGVAEHRWTVDEQCGVLEEEHLDTRGRLTQPGPWSPARATYERDDDGLITRQQCWGDRGRERSCLFLERGHGSVLEMTYDDLGRLVERRAFTSDGDAARHNGSYPHVMRWQYGDDGRASVTTFADTRDRRARGLGVWAFEYDHDSLGAELANRSLDDEGRPMASPDIRCAEIRSRYDDKHRLERLECLDTDGEPTRSRLIRAGVDWKGAAYVEIERDDRGTVLSNVFYSSTDRKLRTLDCSDPEDVCHR